ncbi:MAG: hypothetical protein ABI723_11325 [Bacteroidia bacterium]
MKKIILVISLQALSTACISQDFLMTTPAVKIDQITYRDSSFCKFYSVDTTKKFNEFCQECYYKNKQRKNLQFFTLGKKNGPSMTWFENGNLESINSYLYGCLAGEFRENYDNGNPKIIGSYYINVNDTIIRLEYFYNETIGDSTATYENYLITSGYKSIKDGIWRYYTDDSKLIKREFWEKGKLIKEE